MAHEPLMTALERILNNLTPSDRLRAESTITSAQALVREADRLVESLVSTGQATSAIPHDLPMNQGFVHDDHSFDRETLMRMDLESTPIDLSGYDIKEDVLRLISHSTALHHGVVPLALFDGTLFCALNAAGLLDEDRRDIFVEDDIHFLTGYKAHLVPATPQSFAEVMGYYQRQA